MFENEVDCYRKDAERVILTSRRSATDYETALTEIEMDEAYKSALLTSNDEEDLSRESLTMEQWREKNEDLLDGNRFFSASLLKEVRVSRPTF